MLSSHKLFFFGFDPIPLEVNNRTFRARNDFQTTHEGADVIISHQVIHLAKIGKTQITFLADDTDIFVLLLHAYYENNFTCELVMRGINLSRSIANKGHCRKPYQHPSRHITCSLSYRLRSYIFGIGKATVAKVLKSGFILKRLGFIK